MINSNTAIVHYNKNCILYIIIDEHNKKLSLQKEISGQFNASVTIHPMETSSNNSWTEDSVNKRNREGNSYVFSLLVLLCFQFMNENISCSLINGEKQVQQ
jgi:hypothetical protein